MKFDINMSLEIEMGSDDSYNSEKAFREVIVQSDEFQIDDEFQIEGVSDDDEELANVYETESKENQPRSTKAQLKMLDTAMKDCSDDIDKDLKWEQLTTKLNAIGPPQRSVDRWKRIWSVRKYHKKKPTLTGRPSGNVYVSDQPTLSEPSGNVNVGSYNVQGTMQESYFYQMLQKQDVIINELQRTNDLLQKQDVVIHELQKANNLLETMSKKFT